MSRQIAERTARAILLLQTGPLRAAALAAALGVERRVAERTLAAIRAAGWDLTSEKAGREVRYWLSR